MKHFLFLAGGLLVAGAAHAQLGLRAGGSLANLHTTDGTNLHNASGSLAGYQVGITYLVPLTARLALVPEVQYSRERATLAQVSYAIADAGFSGDYHQRLDYVSVPVLVRATFGPVYVELGPQVGFLLAGRQTGTTTLYSWGWGPNVTTQAVDQDITASYRRFDAGPCVGVGVKLPAGLGLSLRAYRGLMTLNHERSMFDGGLQRQTAQASLTYQLPGRQ